METVDDIEVRLLLEAVHARYGYDLRGYAPASIRRRVHAALAKSGLAHLGALQHRLLTDPAAFAVMLEQLTVQVTEMFRDPAFFLAFRQHVVPFLRTYGQVKFWHAGCASGEEVYSAAIVLWEEELYARTQFYGTDISEVAVERARHGIYPESKLATFADNYTRSGGRGSFDTYYSLGYGNVAVREWLRVNTAFFQHNVVCDHALGTMHVIFCRNLLMYLGPTARDRVLSMFCSSLCHGGFLCLGASETLSPTHAPAFREIVPGQRIYQYRGYA